MAIERRGQPEVYQTLDKLNIYYEYFEHQAAPTMDDALKVWRGLNAIFCKNLFFRNHKGNKHYLVILRHDYQLNIHELEKRLKQGKLSFASEKRLYEYLRLTPGSVTPYGLINDTTNHVHVFLDNQLLEAQKLSFHPNVNTAAIVVSQADFIKYLDFTGNSYEFISLYES